MQMIHYQPDNFEELEKLSRQFNGASDAYRNGLYDFLPIPCDKPTGALPGSTEKIRVMAAREAAGMELYHPLDRRYVSD